MKHWALYRQMNDRLAELGFNAKQKTIKAECGKRVAFHDSQAKFDDTIDCPACKEAHDAHQADMELLRGYMAEMGIKANF